MSTNAPTSRRITYMHCHVDGVSLKFFSKKYFNRKFPIFSKKNISFPLFSKLHFVFLLALHFESFSNPFSFLLYIFSPLPICHPDIHFFYIYIKGTIVENFDLNFFREHFLSLGVFQPNLRNPTWNHHEKSSPLQTCKCLFFLFYIYVYMCVCVLTHDFF